MEASKAPLAAGNVKSWKANFATGLLAAAAAFIGIIAMTAAPESGITTVSRIDPSLEHVMANEITVYGTSDVVN